MSKGAQENDHLLDAVALLVLDVQERLLPKMAGAEVFADRVAFAIEAARHFKLKVIFTEQVPEKLGPTLPRLRQLAPNARVFKKSSFSALQAPGLQDYLRDQNIYHLLICGLETPVCIHQTALQAADLDHDTTLLSDCLASRNPEDDAFVLPALTHGGCHLLPSETVFYSMVADAAEPAFRGYSELVKHYDALRRGEQPPIPTDKPKVQAPPEPKRKAERKKSSRARKASEPKKVAESKKRMEVLAEETVADEPKPALKRNRSRRRKTPAKPTDEAREVEPKSAPPSEPAAKGPGPVAKEDRKPRRRKRGPRKPKPDAAADPAKPSDPEK